MANYLKMETGEVLSYDSEYESKMRDAMAGLLCDLIEDAEVTPSVIRRVADFTAEMIDIYKKRK